MESRVRRLHLSIRGAVADNHETRQLVERFSRNVLEHFCQIVEDRLPGQDVLIRRLDLRCSLSPEQLTDPAEASRFAVELAAAIDLTPKSEALAAEGRWPTPFGQETNPPPALVPITAWNGRSVQLGGAPLYPGEADNPLSPNAWLSDTDPTGPPDYMDRALSVPAGRVPAAATPDEIDWLIYSLRSEAARLGETWLDAPGQDAAALTASRRAGWRQNVPAALSRLDSAGVLINILQGLSARTLAAMLAALDVGAPLRELARLRHTTPPAPAQRRSWNAGSKT
jgi:hypothetical protein